MIEFLEKLIKLTEDNKISWLEDKQQYESFKTYSSFQYPMIIMRFVSSYESPCFCFYIYKNEELKDKIVNLHNIEQKNEDLYYKLNSFFYTVKRKVFNPDHEILDKDKFLNYLESL